MSEMRRIALVVTLALALSFCGVREPGLEVAIELTPPASADHATLDVEAIELLPCPDVPEHIALSLVSVAYAHGLGTATGPFVMTLPGASERAVARVRPGSYCDVRVQFGSASTPALSTGSDAAPQRDAVLRLVDADGAPTRLLLATAPDRAGVRISLGAISEGGVAARALSDVISGASAMVVQR